MKPNLVKQALAAGKPQIGCAFAQLRSPEVARILKAAGFDWAFLDAEHGNFDLETVQDICRVSTLIDFVPVVRVADLQYHLVARALDCGAEGIIFPRVESPELLAKAVSWTKFPPVGIRGFGLAALHTNYTPASVPQIIEHMNEHLLVVLQIETVRAFEMRDELLSIAGLDAVMIGPMDLSISLGVGGQMEHPRMVETIEKIRESCEAHHIHPGIQTRFVHVSKFWRDRGMRFIGCSSETGMLQEKATEVAKALKA
jgi:2-dehydro-3-deoxyglucarate aldolase/4-hydroxy-2-oxoheptanedioate aldolase